MGAFLGKDGVLVALELTAIITLFVVVGAYSKGLRALTTGVDEVYVINLQVGSMGTKSGGRIIVGGVVLALVLGDGHCVGGITGSVRSLSIDGQRGIELLDVNLFVVCALGDEDALC